VPLVAAEDVPVESGDVGVPPVKSLNRRRSPRYSSTMRGEAWRSSSSQVSYSSMAWERGIGAMPVP